MNVVKKTMKMKKMMKKDKDRIGMIVIKEIIDILIIVGGVVVIILVAGVILIVMVAVCLRGRTKKKSSS